MEDEDEAELLTFVGSMKMSDGVEAVLSSIQETLGITSAALYAQASAPEAFSLLRGRTEKIGVFVLLRGDLGSHHSAIDLETFRGLALADDVAPFVVVNDQDSRAAWSFTLLHELAHLWLGQTGVSGERAELSIERFCNDVASQFLLPADELNQLSLAGTSNAEVIRERIAGFAGTRNLSSTMVAYRLYRARRLNDETWNYLRNTFRERWFQERGRQRERGREQEGGPNFYVVRAHRVGSALLNLVERMMGAGALTTSKAGKVLGVKPTQVEALLKQREGRRLA
jgi:Zn-dependent peptidase ImmA (M78 family)